MSFEYKSEEFILKVNIESDVTIENLIRFL